MCQAWCTQPGPVPARLGSESEKHVGSSGKSSHLLPTAADKFQKSFVFSRNKSFAGDAVCKQFLHSGVCLFILLSDSFPEQMVF